MPIDVPMLFVGDKNLPEFSPVANWLTQQQAAFETDVTAALIRIRKGFAPAVIVVAQPWPGHVSSKQIESLRQAAPLARMVSLLGTWLEGEARTGKPWPTVWRTYWHNWLPRFTAELESLAAGEESVWSLPTTAGDDERIMHLCAADSTPPPTQSRKTIAVVSGNRQTAEALGDICRCRGWRSVWVKSPIDELPADIDLVVFDSRNLAAAEIAQISNLKSQNSKIPMVVLAGFPRVEDFEQLKAIGVAAVISKPYFIPELACQLESAMLMDMA